MQEINTKNYRTLIKAIKENQNKWKDNIVYGSFKY